LSFNIEITISNWKWSCVRKDKESYLDDSKAASVLTL